MRPRERLTFSWLLLSFVLLTSLAGIEFYVFVQLSAAQKGQLLELLFPYRYFILVPILILLGLIIFGAKWVLENLWLPLAQLTDEVELLFSSRTSSSLTSRVPLHFQRISCLLNEQSKRIEKLQKGIESKISQAKKELEQEKNVFAALIEELSEGVIVCNSSAYILLYNKSAQELFVDQENGNTAENTNKSQLGLGRSFNTILPTPRLKYTLNELQERHRLGSSHLVQHFSTWFGSKLLRVQTIGILDPENKLSGFVFICEDLAPHSSDYHPHEVLELLHDEQRRASIANIRSSIETLQDYPEMPTEKYRLLMKTIQEHSVKLSEQLTHNPMHNKAELRVLCPLELTPIQEWLQSLNINPERPLKLTCIMADSSQTWYVQLNRYFFSQVLEFLFQQLHQLLHLTQLEIRLDRKDQFIMLDICWQGKELAPVELRNWLNHPLKSISEDQTVYISEILRQHDAEIWFEGLPDSLEHGLRLFVPCLDEMDPKFELKSHINLGSRPVFYDFDLFHKTSLSKKWNEVLLTEATYTVFDTETTGLNPAGGDEIISIGAIRIVNGQILRNETFSQLVNPQREISPQSFQIHGISVEELQDKPLISQVLPLFHSFVQDSILVAHNAAFDLRFLQMKEDSSGLIFDNPVLDTLLLSAVIHPNLDKHDLDTLAQRFGLDFKQRHSAMGDAEVTAQILLELFPMLNSKRINTIQDAQSAAKKSYYARLKY